MTVTVSGLSGDTNAYRSVLSAVGSCEISGASAWLDACEACGCRLLAVKPTPTAAATASPAARVLRGGLTMVSPPRVLTRGVPATDVRRRGGEGSTDRTTAVRRITRIPRTAASFPRSVHYACLPRLTTSATLP